MNQFRECSAIGPIHQDQADENEAVVDPRRTQSLEPLLLKTGEVARLLGLSRSTVFALLAARKLPAVRIGRSVRVPRAALERWIDERTDHQRSAPMSKSPRPEHPLHVPTCGPHRAD